MAAKSSAKKSKRNARKSPRLVAHAELPTRFGRFTIMDSPAVGRRRKP